MLKTPTSKLLLHLLATSGRATVDFAIFFHDMRHHRQAYMMGGHTLVKEYQRLQKQRVALEALRQLQRRNYLKAKKVGNRLLITLTQKGTTASLSSKLQQAPTRTDGLYIVVIFDVPQSQNTARRQLRLLLRQGGFTKLQQSVWMSKTDTYDLIAQFIKRIKLEPWVNVFRARDFLHLVR